MWVILVALSHTGFRFLLNSGSKMRIFSKIFYILGLKVSHLGEIKKVTDKVSIFLLKSFCVGLNCWSKSDSKHKRPHNFNII